MDDQIIYQKIGKILVNSGPTNAKKIIVRAELFKERDGCSYEFDYLDKDNQLDWYDPDSRAVSDLTDTLEELRRFYIANIKPEKSSIWNGSEISLDLETMKINMDFKYEE